ncbi:MAG: type II toxin-antitoxin system VapC family toxin [Rubrobacteraceae bacterium]
MRLLLDTHTFLWFIGGNDDLSGYARSLIEDTGNERLLSVASLWEMAIKKSLGKLKLDLPFPEMVEREIRGNAIEVLDMLPKHLDEMVKLPFHHRDPFDRLIIAQSLSESAPVIGRDEAFDEYPVELLWEMDDGTRR